MGVLTYSESDLPSEKIREAPAIQRRSMAQRDNRHTDKGTWHAPPRMAALRAVVRCSQVPRWGQTK
jgi:hypothetical protein